MLYNTKNPHGGDIYAGKVLLDYSANTNPFGTPQAVQEAIAEALPRLHRYPDPYCRKLVAAIAERETVPEKYILCGNGAADLIYAYARAVHPQKAAMPAPTFSEYALGLSDCEISYYFLQESNDFALDSGILDFLLDGLLTVGSEVEVVSRLVIVLVVIVLNADVYPCVCNEASVAFCVTVVCSRCPVGIIGDIFTGSCDPACEHSSIHIKRILLSADISDLYSIACCAERTSIIVEVVPACVADFIVTLPTRVFKETPAVL